MWKEVFIRSQGYLLFHTMEFSASFEVSLQYKHLRSFSDKKNGTIMYSAYSTHPHAGSNLQLLLTKGDKIWIQTRNSKVAKFHDHGSCNLFSGSLKTSFTQINFTILIAILFSQTFILYINAVAQPGSHLPGLGG